jgi:hypothetical protein
MSIKKAQRLVSLDTGNGLANIIFCQQLGRSAVEVLQMLWTVYGENSQSTVFDCHHRFGGGYELWKFDAQSRQLATSWNKKNVREVQEVVHS